MTNNTRYYAFAFALTGAARAELRAAILERLVDAVEEEAELRARCRDTDVLAATRVRPWELSLSRTTL